MSERPPGSSEPADVPRSQDPAPPIGQEAGSVATREGDAFAGRAEGRRARRDEERNKGPLGFLRELPFLILIAFVLALLIKTFLVQAFYIPSPSMEPTLKVGDRVLVNKLAYRFGGPERGDVIVFENPRPTDEPDRGAIGAFWHWVIEGLGFSTPPDRDFIKRVVGLPGETVEQRGGEIYVDGEVLDEPWLPDGIVDNRPVAPREIPEGYLFVMGDNRTNSNDSRFGLGLVPMDKVVGKAFVIIWPPSEIGWLRGG